jgi:hypothetical protein
MPACHRLLFTLVATPLPIMLIEYNSGVTCVPTFGWD